jgi:hypothetical protein
LHFPVRTGTLAETPTTDRVDLIHEDDARFVFSRVREHLSNQASRFTDVLVHDLPIRESTCSGGEFWIFFPMMRIVERLTALLTTFRKLVFMVDATARASSVLPVKTMS